MPMGVLPYSQATYVDVTELGNSVFGTILGGLFNSPERSGRMHLYVAVSDEFSPKWDGAL